MDAKQRGPSPLHRSYHTSVFGNIGRWEGCEERFGLANLCATRMNAIQGNDGRPPKWGLLKKLTGDRMPTTLACMTLRELLESKGIRTIVEFARRAKISRQYAWNLWHGYQNVGLDLRRRLSERLGIDLEEFIHLDRTRPPAAPAAPASILMPDKGHDKDVPHGS